MKKPYKFYLFSISKSIFVPNPTHEHITKLQIAAKVIIYL